MRRSIQTPSFRDGPKDQTSDAQLRIGESRDSGFDASHRPGMTSIDYWWSLQSSQLPRIAERKRRNPPRVLIEDQCPRDRRLGPLAAVFAFAKPAIYADRRALGFFQIHPGGVDQPRGVADFAPQPDRKAWLSLRMRRHRPAHHLRDRKISGAVGQFDHLLEQAVRRVEG